MTIDGLNALTTLTAGDELPVWDVEASGEPTKKITASNLAASVKSLGSLIGTGDLDSTPTSGSNKAVTSGGVYTAIQQSTAYTEVGTRNGNVNANSSCMRLGNVVVCSIRYDQYADISLYTGLPTAQKTAWAQIWGDTTHWGAIEILAGQTSLTFANKGTSGAGAKIGQLVYITSDA